MKRIKEGIKIFLAAFRKLILLLVVLPYHLFIFISLIAFRSRRVAFGYLTYVESDALMYILRILGARIGKGTVIQKGVVFHNCRNFVNLNIGENVHIGKGAFIDLREKITIHNNVTIAMNCTLLTHQDVGSSNLIDIYHRVSEPLVIYENSYIGEGVTVLMGVTIGMGTVIGTKALVINNCVEGSVYVGIPAKRVKSLNG